MTEMALVSSELTEVVDLSSLPVRELNRRLHEVPKDEARRWKVLNPAGAHSIAVGLTADLDVDIEGDVGYYCAGMNQRATVRVRGSAGTGLAENIMSGTVLVDGDASAASAATGRGGLVVIRGNAAARCGISMKGVDIVVGGSIGHMGAFMGQKGRLVVCGDAGEALGDSLYEAHVYIRGSVASLGADCIEKPMEAHHAGELMDLLDSAQIHADPYDFKRYGSARQLYHFDVDNAAAY